MFPVLLLFLLLVLQTHRRTPKPNLISLSLSPDSSVLFFQSFSLCLFSLVFFRVNCWDFCFRWVGPHSVLLITRRDLDKDYDSHDESDDYDLQILLLLWLF